MSKTKLNAVNFFRGRKVSGFVELSGKVIGRMAIDNPLLLIFIGIIVILTFLIPRFLTIRNLSTFACQASFIGLIVLGEFLVILTAGIDLSVGSVMAFSACLLTGLIVWNGLPIPVAICAALLSGVAAGLLSGIAVAYFRVPPFVATLAVMGIWRGLALIYTGRSPISGLPPFFLELGGGTIVGVPVPTIILVVIAVAIHLILKHTKLGMHIYAIGGNEEAAYSAGVAVPRIKIFAYCASGILSSLSGILMAARLISAQPLMGLGWELRAIAGAVVGGTSLFGGVGTAGGAVLGTLTVEIITNGMNLMNILKYWQQIIIGIILMSSLVIVQLRK